MKHLLGEASTEEQAEVNRWLEHDPANLAYYRQLEKIWVTSRELASTSAVDENKAWKNFRQRIHNNQIKETPVSAPVRSVKQWRKIAAAVIVLLGLGWIGFAIINNGKTKQQVVIASQTIIVDTLSDGSVVTLNKQSELSYPARFKGRSRPVKLKGEAFFDVAPNKAKPFIITVGDVEVTVVGTSFNIRSYDDVTEITVETGIVEVMHKGVVTELRAGVTGVFGAQQNAETKQAAKGLTNYYRPREFNCDDTPLWKLVDAMNKAYDTTIVIENTALNNLLVDGYFPNRSVTEILNKVIEGNVNYQRMSMEVKRDTIILK